MYQCSGKWVIIRDRDIDVTETVKYHVIFLLYGSQFVKSLVPQRGIEPRSLTIRDSVIQLDHQNYTEGYVNIVIPPQSICSKS